MRSATDTTRTPRAGKVIDVREDIEERARAEAEAAKERHEIVDSIICAAKQLEAWNRPAADVCAEIRKDLAKLEVVPDEPRRLRDRFLKKLLHEISATVLVSMGSMGGDDLETREWALEHVSKLITEARPPAPTRARPSRKPATEPEPHRFSAPEEPKGGA